MWAIIVLLTIGLYNMFKNPQGSFNQNNKIIFSEFLSEVENGRVVQVEIQEIMLMVFFLTDKNFQHTYQMIQI